MAFPLNPVLADQHTIGTQIYQWNGVAWDIAIATTPGTVEAELNALVSEAVASTSETNAAASELASATSETNAAASAAAALSSENNVASIETSINTTFDTFDDRFLGTFTTDPTLDNDGNAISVGAVYYNSATSSTKFYNGSTWDNPSQSASTSATNALASENATALSETNAANSATEAAGLLSTVYTKTESDSLYDPIGASVAMAIALGG